MTTAEPTIRRWTREEYYRVGESGLLDGQRVELIDGEIIQMAPQKDLHAAGVGLAASAVQTAFGAGIWVRQQLPIRIGNFSEPEPDVSVVPGGPRDYVRTDHPNHALLVIEVSDTTLGFDRKRKASLYASAGIADYWIVNLIDGQLEVHRDPIPDAGAAFGHRYGSVVVQGRNDSITPLAAPAAQITVADLLP